MVSCKHVKFECLRHCYHSVPHERCRHCKDACCPVTHKRLDCDEKPGVVSVHENLRVDGAFIWKD